MVKVDINMRCDREKIVMLNLLVNSSKMICGPHYLFLTSHVNLISWPSHCIIFIHIYILLFRISVYYNIHQQYHIQFWDTWYDVNPIISIDIGVDVADMVDIVIISIDIGVNITDMVDIVIISIDMSILPICLILLILMADQY